MQDRIWHPRIFLVFGLALTFLAINDLSSNRVEAQGQTCHLRELDLCSATLLMFTQTPNGLATTDQEINKQCNHLKDSDTCLRNYTRRCMTPVQRDMASFAANASFAMLTEYCTKGSSLRTGFMKHAACLNKVDKKEQRVCVRDFQVSLELITEGRMKDNSKGLQLACCTYNRLKSCLANLIDKKCGKETLKFIDGVVDRATSRLPDMVCRNYKPDSSECKALLPKSGTAPRGSKSNSILSRLMTAYTGA